VTTGRRTGRPHTVTLWFAHEDGILWLRADRDADWYQNLIADPRCRIRIEDEEFAGLMEALSDGEAALRHLISIWREKYGGEWVGDWYIERGRIPVHVRVVRRA